jgi:hypothetical protein
MIAARRSPLFAPFLPFATASTRNIVLNNLQKHVHGVWRTANNFSIPSAQHGWSRTFSVLAYHLKPLFEGYYTLDTGEFVIDRVG